ncbi:hypothetical protein LCGC14_1782800 [marine sediment metagenome]|uniref:Uncharacterized protein n=1 Tax=marine sediment metagenome TaxID=412755 RepID=A0A0F9GV02_9ZZZZ
MNGFGAEGMKRAAAMLAPDHSPHPWHVRLGGYRVDVPITETIPQLLADGWTEVMQTAVEVWADPEGHFQPDLEFIDLHDDEMIEKRIAGYQVGYDKEWVRREVGGHWHDFREHKYQEKERYIFADMPMALKRAIVSRWDVLHYQYMLDHEADNLRYHKDFGYYWRIEVDGVVARVKMWDGADKGKCPDKKFSEDWERAGVPGGLYGYAGRLITGEVEDLWRFVEGVSPPDLRVNKGQEENWSGD